MHSGVLAALGAYAIFSCADATIKGFDGSLTVFQIGFFTTLFSLVPAFLSKTRNESWRDVVRLKHPWLVQVRGLAGVGGSASVIYAFSRVPLAEVYSIGFLTPLFVVCLSALVLREQVAGYRWLLVLIGFAGVLIVTRPGFQRLDEGHIAALCASGFAAISTIVVRHISDREHRLSIFGVVAGYSLVVNGGVIVLFGLAMPDLLQLLTLAAIGLGGGIGHLLFLRAARLSPANHIAPTQYSQLAWAIVLGALFYSEFPDAVALVGLSIVLGAGLLNVLPQDRCIAVISRFSMAVRRRREAVPCTSPAETSLTPEL